MPDRGGDRDERPGQEDLREDQERDADGDDLGILGDADEEDAERAAGEGEDRGQGEDPEQVAGVHRDLHHDDHRDDPDEREEGGDARADQLAEQDRVARDRGHEELGGEVVLAFLDEVGDPGDGALVHRVGDHPDEHVREVGVRQRAARGSG